MANIDIAKKIIDGTYTAQETDVNFGDGKKIFKIINESNEQTKYVGKDENGDGKIDILYTVNTGGEYTNKIDINSVQPDAKPKSVQTAVWEQYIADTSPDLAGAIAFWKLYGDKDSGVQDKPYLLGLGALQTAYALVGRQGLAQIVQGLGAGLWHVLATPMRQPQYKPDG